MISMKMRPTPAHPGALRRRVPRTAEATRGTPHGATGRQVTGLFQDGGAGLRRAQSRTQTRTQAGLEAILEPKLGP